MSTSFTLACYEIFLVISCHKVKLRIAHLMLLIILLFLFPTYLTYALQLNLKQQVSISSIIKVTAVSGPLGVVLGI